MTTLVAAGIVASSVGVVLLPTATTLAAPTPEFTLDFTGLATGAPMTRVGSATLERDARYAGFQWLELDGLLADSTLIVIVCDTAGTCADSVSGVGAQMVAGALTVDVTAVLNAEAEPGDSGSALGQLTFAADDDLAFTGWDAAPWLAAGAALLSVGILLLALRRTGRRSPS